MTRLLIRGGSIAAGDGVARGYAEILRDLYAPRGVEVVNRSRPGETSFDGVETFARDVEPFRPDILVVHFGMDDAYSAVYRSEFKENLVRIVRLARERSPAKIYLTTSHTLDDPHEMEALHIYYRTIREVAVDLACEMVPVHTAWAGHLMDQGMPNASLLQADARLPNEKGHELYASILDGYLGLAQPATGCMHG
jgi:lysophospholipase L1-like esterase